MKQTPSVEELLRRFRNNECTVEELKLLMQWVARLDVSGESVKLTPQQLQELKARMYRQLVAERTTAPVRSFSLRRYRIAATWLVLIAGSILLWYVNTRLSVAHAPAVSALTVIENNATSIKKVLLPDSTLVYLNANSRLEFNPREYNRQQRTIELSGEGFFEVVPSYAAHQHDEQHRIPFTVETGSLRTRVLGTAFNIEAYNNESEIRVSLVHGKVAMYDTLSDRTTLLAPNQMYRYSKQTNSREVLPVVAANTSLWTTGSLVFNETPLPEALERIKVRYHIAIDYDPARMQHKRITATFHAAPVATVLNSILFVHDLQCKEVGEKKYEVRGQRSEVRGLRPEVRGQRSEVRGLRPEVRGQRSEVRSSK